MDKIKKGKFDKSKEYILKISMVDDSGKVIIDGIFITFFFF